MRMAAENNSGTGGAEQITRFHSIDGTAENTTLADHSVDAITAAQTFHWLDLDPTKSEMRRILKPDSWLALI